MEINNPAAAGISYQYNKITEQLIFDFMKWCYVNAITFNPYSETEYKEIIKRYLNDESARPSGDYLKQAVKKK
jgi:hypothetical protein